MIRKLKKAMGIRFSVKALVRNPNVYLLQSTHRFRCFPGLVEMLASKRPISIVQIGANDGVTNDPIGELVLNRPGRIRGLLIEPQRGAFHRLSQRYGDAPNIVCLRAAIAGKPGTRRLYSVNRSTVAEKLPGGVSDGIGSFDRQHVETILRSRAPGLPPQDINVLITEETVPAITLLDALSEADIDEPDVLLVDTEGCDADIVHGALDAEVRPALIQYEHKHLTNTARRSVSKRLMRNGYRLWSDHADVWGQRAGVDFSVPNS